MITVMRAAAAAVCATAVLAPAGGAAAHDATTSLVFTRTEPDRAPRTVTLTCDPVGGSHPDAAGACDYLTAAELTLPDTDANVRCVRYYPVELRAHGTVHGTPVSVERTYGCRVPELPTPWQF